MVKPPKPSQAARIAAQLASEPFETLGTQVAKPIFDEALNELGGFFGLQRNLSKQPKTLGQEDLRRAREKENIERMNAKDEQESAQLIQVIRGTYTTYEQKVDREQQSLTQEFQELQSEVAKLAKTAGVETKAHLQNKPTRIGILDLKLLTSIIRFLRIKAEESKSGQDLVSQRTNAKAPTGMMAWVSGKQMQIHEQGTLQLQG